MKIKHRHQSADILLVMKTKAVMLKNDLTTLPYHKRASLFNVLRFFSTKCRDFFEPSGGCATTTPPFFSWGTAVGSKDNES